MWWLEDAQAGSPDDVSTSIHTVFDSSEAAGLLTAAHQLESSAIILGSRGGILRRYTGDHDQYVAALQPGADRLNASRL